MLERTTFTNLVNRAISHLQSSLRELERLHSQAATGKKLLRPSDDPVSYSTAQVYRSAVGQLEALLANLTDVRLSLQTSSQALQLTSGLLAQARALAAEGAHDTLSEEARRSLATEVDGLLEQIVALANSRTPDHYVFAGTRTAQEPFRAVRDSQGRIVRVEYLGNFEEGTASVAPGNWVRFLYSGPAVFKSRSSGAGTIFGDATGLALGTGTAQVRGRIFVQLQHTSTIYAPGSGVTPGISSASGDTILGSSGTHTLFLRDTSGTGANGIVSLNGGPVVTWTSTDTDLQVFGPNGETVFIDTTSITPGFSGTVAIAANGTLATSDGSTVPITFSPNQQVTDALGNTLFLDTTQVQRTGTNWVEFPHSYDIFSALIDLRDDLLNIRGLTPAQQTQALSRMVAAVDAVHDGVLQALGEQAATLVNLETLEQQMQEVQLDLRARVGSLEEADLAELVVRLQAQQNQLTLLLAATVQVLQPSLLDFLR